MKSILYFLTVMILAASNTCANTKTTFETYPQPKDAAGKMLPGSPKFKVTVLTNDKETESFVYYSRGERRFDIADHQDESSFIENKSVSFTSFSFNGKIIVSVTPLYINKIEKCIVRRNVFWMKEWGGVVMFSYSVNDDYKNVHVYDCDVIHAEDKTNAGNSGLFLAYHGGAANISDILIEDIRCECDIPYLIDITFTKTLWSKNTREFGSISDICIRNIRIAGKLLHPSRLIGNSPGHQVSNIRFEDITVDDNPVKSSEDVNMFIGPFVKNIRFISRGVQTNKTSITDDEKATIVVPMADVTVENNPEKRIYLSTTHSIVKNSNEVFMKFDLSQINEVRQAKLVLLSQSYFVRSRYNTDERVIISISQVGNNWVKASINWESSRSLNSRKITSFKPNDNLMKVDLTDFIKENAGKIVSLKFENNLSSWAGFKDSNACSPALMVWD